MKFNKDASPEEIDAVMEKSWNAFQEYKKTSFTKRAALMRAIAVGISDLGDELIQTAMAETNLPKPRLEGERARTIFQLNSYAAACEQGDWLQARIDTALPERALPRPDIRKTQVPLGPVVVFGASNFPFAYSTAGGDTACAFAAGCTVVVKAHPAHPKTSELVSNAIFKAVKICGLPDGTFQHLYGAGNEVGKALVTHAYTKSLAFTGSFGGGKALFDWANQREIPIPVFAEMGSVNPVFLLPEKLRTGAQEIARMYAASITLSVGQFCTNPGIIIGLEGPAFEEFASSLSSEIENTGDAAMLHPGIARSFNSKRAAVLSQKDVTALTPLQDEAEKTTVSPTIAHISGKAFLGDKLFSHEIFGPFALLVACKNMQEMLQVASSFDGQLTATIMGFEEEILAQHMLIDIVAGKCGRLIFNGVPTGVEVCLSMHHGGPYPSTTDARFTAVGADGIRRFTRPLCLQNCIESLLPDELKNDNPLRIWRTINGELTKN